jgi:hypothetical protein
MKLSYTRNGQDYAIDSRPSYDDALKSAIATIAEAFEIAEDGVCYLLQNGWSQSLQDSYAGPRAKALKANEPEDTVEAIVDACMHKRMQVIKSGAVNSPIRSVGMFLMKQWAVDSALQLPSDKESLLKLLDKYIEKNEQKILTEIAARKTAKAALTKVSVDDLAALM